MTQRNAAFGGLALGLVIALAANLTYALPRGGVVVGLGLVAPLVLPVVLYLRTTFTADGFWSRALRELSTLAVAGPAVAVSYSHTYELVLAAGEPWILAFLAPLSSDGLAGMATLALHRQRHQHAAAGKPPAPKSRPERVTTPAPRPATTPDGPPKLEPLHAIGKGPSMSAQVRAWLAAELDAGREPTGADADLHFGLEGAARCGARALRKVLDDRERRAV
jgi:hypothetical protein